MIQNKKSLNKESIHLRFGRPLQLPQILDFFEKRIRITSIRDDLPVLEKVIKYNSLFWDKVLVILNPCC